MRTRMAGDKKPAPAKPVARRPHVDPKDMAGIFEDVARPLPAVPKMSKGFEQVSTALFATGYDVAGEFEQLRDALTIKDALSPTHVKAAANRAEDVALRAMRLYVVGKVEYATYTRRTDSIVGAMREAVTAILEQDKAEGRRTKQITNEDVEKGAAQKFPDEWEDVHVRRVRAKEMLRYLEQLAALAKSRAYTLSNILGNDRSM